MSDFYVKCDRLHQKLMGAIAQGLGMDATYLKKQIRAGDHCLGLLQTM